MLPAGWHGPELLLGSVNLDLRSASDVFFTDFGCQPRWCGGHDQRSHHHKDTKQRGKLGNKMGSSQRDASTSCPVSFQLVTSSKPTDERVNPGTRKGFLVSYPLRLPSFKHSGLKMCKKAGLKRAHMSFFTTV